MRITDAGRPIVRRGNSFYIEMDSAPLLAYEGETVASVLLANGRRVLRKTRGQARPRGLFCGIGVCYDCLVVIDGRPNLRACMTRVTKGMKIETQLGVGAPPMEAE